MSSARRHARGHVSCLTRERKPGDALRFNENRAADVYALRAAAKREAGELCFDHLSHVPYMV